MREGLLRNTKQLLELAPAEDVNGNGVLDDGEDANENGVLDEGEDLQWEWGFG